SIGWSGTARRARLRLRARRSFAPTSCTRPPRAAVRRRSRPRRKFPGLSSLVVGQLLARRAAPRVARALALRAKRRVGHHFEPLGRDLVAALVADPERVRIVLELAQRAVDARDPLR